MGNCYNPVNRVSATDGSDGSGMDEFFQNLEFIPKILKDARQRTSLEKLIITRALIVIVVPEESEKFLELYKFVKDDIISEKMCNFSTVYTSKIGEIEVFVSLLNKDDELGRHESGHTKVSASLSLLNRELAPDLVISFGTAGGIGLDVGDVVMGNASFYLDRTRLSTQRSFEWGILGGAAQTVVLKGIPIVAMGSHQEYDLSNKMWSIINHLEICTVDMESAAVCEVCHIMKTPVVLLKVVSDVIRSENAAADQENTYRKNKLSVSNKASEMLFKLLTKLNDHNELVRG